MGQCSAQADRTTLCRFKHPVNPCRFSNLLRVERLIDLIKNCDYSNNCDNGQHIIYKGKLI